MLEKTLSWSDYYPFGLVKDSRNSQSSSYRFGFQGQERDDEVAGEGVSWSYKYRMHNAKYSRFFSVDPLSGSYPWNSPYAFSENRVIDARELEGLEMVLIHGTFAKRKDRERETLVKADYKGGSTWNKSFGENLAKSTGWSEDQTFEWTWSGANTAGARKMTAYTLAYKLMNPEINPDANNKHVTLVGHSHGGNVVKEAQNILVENGWTVDVINIATPQRKDHQYKESEYGIYLNFYSENDLIQWFGTDDNYITRDSDNIGCDGERQDCNANVNEGVGIKTNWFLNSGGHSYHQDSQAQEQIIETVEKEFNSTK